MPFSFDSLIVPQPVVDQVMFRVAQRSPFIGSGVASLTNDAQAGGNFYARRVRDEDATRANVIDGVTSHTATIIDAVRDLAPVLRRVRPRMVVDGSMAAEGRLSANPTEDVIAQSATYWQREIDEALLAVVNALLDSSAGCLKDTHLKSVATGSAPYVPLSYASVVNAATLAGDSVSDYAAIVVHSKQWADVQLENAAKTTFLPLGGSAPVPFLGTLRVIVSDGVPVDGSGASAAYTAILLRPGALYISVQQPLREFVVPDPSIPAIKVSESMHFAAGAEGCKWVDAGSNPANSVLDDAAKWEKTAAAPSADSDKRTIGLIGLVTNATSA